MAGFSQNNKQQYFREEPDEAADDSCRRHFRAAAGSTNPDLERRHAILSRAQDLAPTVC